MGKLSWAAAALAPLAALSALQAAASPMAPHVGRRDTAVSLVLDPSYQQPPFQGWGTSLAWMGVVTGGYPDAIRKQLVSMVFGADGLNLNIARYNVGGGNAPSVADYLRPGGAVPGWWNSPNASYGPSDKDWWDPTNASHWNLAADPNQRWWIDQIKDVVTHWEIFSNSPPWFQTVSGYVSGGFVATDEQIRSDKINDFATYLVKVAEALEAAHGIKVATIEPVNEPNTDYWSTTLTNGVPTGGRQEGCHAGPTMQSNVAIAVKNRLATSSSSAIVSSPDETNPSTFLTDFYGWNSTGAADIGQLHLHSYGTDQRASARDVAKSAGKDLWMSEVEGSWGTDYTSMDSGLGIAQHLVDDIRLLEPAAWVLWQPIEDLYNMIAEGNLQWGEIHVPFNCTSSSTLADCTILTNTKYHALRQFTHYVRPNDSFIRVATDTSTLAAVKGDGSGVVVVHVNADSVAHDLTLDFSGFSSVSSSATVTPIVTSAAGALVQGAAVAVSSNKAALTVPASSVSTLVVSGVSGVLASSAIIRPSTAYLIQGVQSSKYLQPSSAGTSLVINALSSGSTAQEWTFRRLTTGTYSSRDHFVILNVGSGQRLTVSSSGSPQFEADSTTVSSYAQWLVSTSGDGTFTIVNAGVRAILDVTSQSTSNNAAVGTYQPNGGSNQSWKITAA